MAKQRQMILEAAQRMNAPAPSTNKEEVAAMQARLAAAQQQQQQAKQAQAQLQQQQQQQQAALPQPPPQQQGNAFANMTPQQLMAYGFNPTQVEYMRSQQQAEASATAGLAAANGDVKPPGPQRQNSMSSLKPQTTEPSLEQMSEARSVVNQLRMGVEGARRTLFFSSSLDCSTLTSFSPLQPRSSPSTSPPRIGLASPRLRTNSYRSSRRLWRFYLSSSL